VDDWRRADATIGVGFDERLQRIAREGGRVLALIEDVASVTAELGPLEIVERAGTGYEGDWASSFSWLYADRLAHRIPSGPRLDWAFATVAPDQVICGLTAEELRQNALAGLFLGWIQQPAALAVQLRVGPEVPLGRVPTEGRARLGKLILTTLRLARPRGSALGADPAATVLFHDLVEQLLG